MSGMQARIRSAIGALKDQTSISLAKVAGGGMPDLDVALVRATSHEETAMEERWVQEVLHLASYSRAHVAACVAGIARRLARTRTWVVALKALMLAHRALREGDAGFEAELKAAMAMTMGRRGGVLDASGFRDESEAHGWDYSAFIHAYGRYLEERLGPGTSFGRLAASKPRPGHNHRRSFAASSKHYEYSDSAYYHDSNNNYYYNNDPDPDSTSSSPSRQRSSAPAPKAVKDMPPPELLDSSLSLVRVLERALSCRPSGLAKSHRLVSIALFPVVRESFLAYLDLRDSLALVLDAFFALAPRDASRASDLFARSARLVDDLAAFYGFCKALGVCRGSEYPPVDKISDDTLEMMDDFLRSARSRNPAAQSPPPPPPLPTTTNANGHGRRRRQQDEEEVVDAAVDDDDDESSYEINGMKALPAPPLPPAAAQEASSSSSSTAPAAQQPNLIDVHDPPLSSEEHENRLALALFSADATNANTAKWEPFPSAAASSSREAILANANGRPTVSSIANGGGGGTSSSSSATGWELALIEAESEISKPRAAKTQEPPLAGGFNNLLLESLYEQAETRQKTMAAVAPVGSASSVAVLGRAHTNFLALPAPPSAATALSHDPFAASVSVPPPAYVQMSEMRHKQQLLVQEQQQWLQYQQMLHPHAPAYSALMPPKYPNNPFGAASAFQQPNAYPVSYYGHNPFIR